MKTFIIALFAFLFASCASSHKVYDISAPVDVRGKLGNSVIGMNDKGEGIVQEEVLLEDELRMEAMVNSGHQDNVLREHASLKWCREQLSDDRLGGLGQEAALPDVSNLRADEKVTEQIGTDPNTGELKIVRTKMLKENIVVEKRYSKTLLKTLWALQEENHKCTRQLESARRKAAKEVAGE